MKLKAVDLQGTVLDYVVASLEGHRWRCPWLLEEHGLTEWLSYERAWGNPHPEYSADWGRVGPLLEREKLSVREEADGCFHAYQWDGTDHCQLASGATPLEAALRGLVIVKLGPEVEVPEPLARTLRPAAPIADALAAASAEDLAVFRASQSTSPAGNAVRQHLGMKP